MWGLHSGYLLWLRDLRPLAVSPRSLRSRIQQRSRAHGKARVITRRAYGFHSAHGLIAMLKLCYSGITLEPVFLWPGSTH